MSNILHTVTVNGIKTKAAKISLIIAVMKVDKKPNTNIKYLG